MYLSFVIAMVVALGWGLGTIFYNKARGYSNKGQYECKKAREIGCVTEGKLLTYIPYDADSTGDSRYFGTYYENIYTYEVDGRSYKYHDTNQCSPDTIEICYKRNRPDKPLDPSKRSLWDHVQIILVPIIFFALLYLLNR